MIAKDEFIEEVLGMARRLGFTISANRRNGEPEIDFGDRRLRAEQIGALWPAILAPGADVAAQLDKVASGRECAHGPLRDILAQLRIEHRL